MPQYNKKEVSVGIVHIGPGAFHRAHQAVYVHKLLNLGHLNWGICELSINSSGVRDALSPQNYTYTLAQLDKTIEYHAIDSIAEYLVAPESPRTAILKLASADIKLISLTITEKGYCLNSDGLLDQNKEDVQHDLKNLSSPKTALGYLVAGLKERFDTTQQPVCIMSCDNLIHNGNKLRQSVLQFSKLINIEFALWIEKNIAFPCTMVDSITPATTDVLREQVKEATCVSDAWPIQREGFCQWVIEDISDHYDVTTLPDWTQVGATISNDVAAYEDAKLRILNGTHTSLSMLGGLCKLETVEDAIKQPALHSLIKNMLSEEIIPSLNQNAGIDYTVYSNAILTRYENPNIRHLLSQIAWDSSQKLPIRLLATISDTIKIEKTPTLLCTAVAAWIHFVIDKVKSGEPIVDPMAASLDDLVNDDTYTDIVSAFLALDTVFPATLKNNALFVQLVKEGFERIGSLRGQALIAALENH